MKESIFSIVFFMSILSCTQSDYTPKPTGYLRTDFPKKEYIEYNGVLPYAFEYPKYGQIKLDTESNTEKYWINIEFSQHKAKIHISYKAVNNELDKYIEDARKLAYKHTLKADAIDETVIEDKERSLYGIIYDIKGNTASSVQFYLSDQKKHFLRGALYFTASPNKDSLAPSIAFYREDIVHFIRTLRWKN